MSDAAAVSCGQRMRGLYGAVTTCARPKGHGGKHNPIWDQKDWASDDGQSPAAWGRA